MSNSPQQDLDAAVFSQLAFRVSIAWDRTSSRNLTHVTKTEVDREKCFIPDEMRGKNLSTQKLGRFLFLFVHYTGSVRISIQYRSRNGSFLYAIHLQELCRAVGSDFTRRSVAIELQSGDMVRKGIACDAQAPTQPYGHWRLQADKLLIRNRQRN
jgi:hypothetical protein